MMSEFPESLLAAARAVQLMRERRTREGAMSSLMQSTLYGDSRPSEIIVREDLKRREQWRQDAAIEAHYERELAAYEASLKQAAA